ALSGARLPSPRVDAELLAAHVLGVVRSRLWSVSELSDDQLTRYRTLVAQRATHVPLQHLTGTAPFRRLELAVGPGVFVPRPETEGLVEGGLRWLDEHSGHTVVDLCAGSGAIAASVATERANLSVVAVEDDAAALVWLRRNVEPYAVSIVDADATAPATLSDMDSCVDLVL